jgi:hypothetical protein
LCLIAMYLLVLYLFVQYVYVHCRDGSPTINNLSIGKNPADKGLLKISLQQLF